MKHTFLQRLISLRRGYVKCCRLNGWTVQLIRTRSLPLERRLVGQQALGHHSVHWENNAIS